MNEATFSLFPIGYVQSPLNTTGNAIQLRSALVAQLSDELAQLLDISRFSQCWLNPTSNPTKQL